MKKRKTKDLLGLMCCGT